VNDFEAMDYFRDQRLVADPYPYLEAMREQCPVKREPHHRVMMVTGYDEAVEVFGDAEKFSSCISVTGPFPGFPVPVEGRDDVTDLIEAHRDELPMHDQLPTLDPPTHTAHRALLMRLITPKRLKENEAHMWTLADGMLAPFLAQGKGDFIRDLAGPFTLLIIADLLGVPEEDQEDFLRTLQHDLRATGGGVGSTGADTLAHNPLEFLYGRFSDYVNARRAEPREDVLTGLATATFPDGSLPDAGDVARVAANVFSAGQETTVRLLGSALKMIAEKPDVQAQLRAERHRLGNFIEEILRLESPVKGDFRLSKVPVTVGGVDIPAGTTVMVSNGAANRDPRRFPDPDTLDPARSNARQHIAFGRGIHSCPGAPLARAEARALIERLFDHTTDIRIDEAAHGPADNRRYNYLPTFILRGLTHLHLEFDVAEVAEERTR
jgi:cytochrome P450